MAHPIDRLPASFYQRTDVVRIAHELLGKTLCSRISGKLTKGIITETEAYAGVDDRASHAYGGRHTERTRIMYLDGGVAYVYLIYGIHSLFNVVTNRAGVPHAVLIRSIFPVDGLDTMASRRGRPLPAARMCVGPGTVSQAMGIHYRDTGTSLLQGRIWIEAGGLRIDDSIVTKGPRIGVDYAGPDALLPYRFYVSHRDIPALSAK